MAMRPATPLWDVDVVVCGAGSAGMTAAISAARQGASVALLERYGFPGGISTQVLDTFYGFYTPGERAERVVGGLPWEIAAALLDAGDAIARPNSYGAGTGITYNPNALKVLWERTALAAGVQILYHAFICGVECDDRRLSSVMVATKAGLLTISGRVFVDATGDGDVAALAGAPFERAGELGEAQSMTTTFTMINVDVERARTIRQPQLQALMANAIDSGRFDLPRREGSVHITPLAGVMATNMTRVAGLDPTNPVELTRAEIEGRWQALEYARFLREMAPGYERASLGSFSNQIGIRESRRISGEYRLERADVLSGRDFADGIARCGAPIESHHAGRDTRWEYIPNGGTYAIPYRSLVPLEVEGLLIAGRCLSATYDAHASVRSMAQCMAMGQAAGTAAAICARTGGQPRALPVSILSGKLIASGAIL